MTARILNVYWDKVLVGQLAQNDTAELSFIYNIDFLAAAQIGISVSLPLREEVFIGKEVEAFFSGLLPDEDARRQLARILGVSEGNSFALLREIGGECAGALSLYPEEELPPKVSADDFEPLDGARLVEILAELQYRPLLAGEDGLRLSLAGAQAKLPIIFKDNHVLLPNSGQPTTHILKPAIGHIAGSIHNELFSMRLAAHMRLEAPKAEIHFAGDVPYYLVERYDRAIRPDGAVARLHQEDFCQASAILPGQKYEREGGPNIAACQELILQHTAQPAADRNRFLDRVIFNYLIGNADAHGKNFSLLYHGGKPALAPAYDLLSTAIYPELDKKMAMKIGGKYKPEDIFLRHWQQLVPPTKTAQAAFDKRLKSMAESIEDKAHSLRHELESEGISSPVFADICQIITERAKRVRGYFNNSGSV